jgi:hypothetical protein
LFSGRKAIFAVVGASLTAGCGAAPLARTADRTTTQSGVDAVLASATSGSPTRTFVLDNVSLTVTTAYLPAVAFVAAVPGDTTQMASASQPTPYRELSVTAVAAGTRAASEKALPLSSPGGDAAYRAGLHGVRSAQGASFSAGPVAYLFGQAVQGELSVVSLALHAKGLWPTAVVEWVAELGGRQWIVRAAEELSGDPTSQRMQEQRLAQSVRGLSISATGAERPTTVGQVSAGVDTSITDGGVFLAGRAQSSPGATLAAAGTGYVVGTDNGSGRVRLATANQVPMPSWWKGSQCDDAYHFAASGVHTAAIGPAWMGLVPCGPPHPDTGVGFGGGGALEFECVELSMRWLYQEYGQNTYPANGSEVVANYPGKRLQKVSNGSGSAPAPGDVMSFGATSTNGHTAVVTDVHFSDATKGDGTVIVLAENAGGNGYASQNMVGWVVQAGIPITGWLHDPTDPQGYWLTGSDGGIFPYGFAAGYGTLGNLRLNQPIVGMAATPDGSGNWLVAADGGIFPFGSAGGYGSTGAIHLNKPIVGMAATPDGRGYWLVASDGGIFPFGNAGGYGSTGGIHLNQPIVGMTGTPDGRGYWLVASDGGIFPFGDAAGYGSTGGIHLNQPIVGMAATHDGGGYWLVARDGGMFPFGPAAAGYGSAAGVATAAVVGIAATADGRGYWVVSKDGNVYPYGDARDYGGAKSIRLSSPIVGIASFG